MPKAILYLIIFLLTFGLTAAGPWWFAAAIPFVMALYFHLRPFQGLGAGFVLNLAVWALLIFIRDSQNQGILSHKMAAIFGMPPFAFMVANLLFGSILGGLAGSSGAYISYAFHPQGTSLIANKK